jgi:hypothetical protein
VGKRAGGLPRPASLQLDEVERTLRNAIRRHEAESEVAAGIQARADFRLESARNDAMQRGLGVARVAEIAREEGVVDDGDGSEAPPAG